MPQLFEQTLNPAPRRWIRHGKVFRWPQSIGVAIDGINKPDHWIGWKILRDDLTHLLNRGVTLTDNASDAQIVLTCRNAPDSARLLPEKGYALRVTPERITVNADTTQGAFYGVQTLCQLITIDLDRPTGPVVQCCDITDWPTHRLRWMMPDMGRAVLTPALLRRLVRIAARLKYNGLHLHLNDNELNPVRYEGTPLGSENPFAQPIGEFEKLVAYAREYHVEIIPEVESWGHAGSLLQHYPHLYGATRLHGYGHSLAIGPQTFDFLEKLYDQWIAILPDGSHFHVGLDEANFRRADGADPSMYNRKTIVRHIHDRVQARAKAHGKQVRTMIWGGGIKHADVFVPPELRDQIVVGPWHYQTADGAREQLMRHWVRDTKRFNADGEMRSPFVGGCGTNGVHEFGCFEATLTFGRLGMEFPNCLGLDVMSWATNDVHGRMAGTFFGGACAWNPVEAERLLRRDMAIDVDFEAAVATITHFTRTWQSTCRDADPDAINADRGDEVLMGKYRWGSKRNQPVAPIWTPKTMIRGDQPES